MECDDDVDEVCGDDGETYSNRCHAKCFRVGVKCKGRCPCDGGDSSVSRPDSLDTDEVERCEQKCDEDEPTCGRDGKEYNSPCHARCHGVVSGEAFYFADKASVFHHTVISESQVLWEAQNGVRQGR